MRAQMDMAPSMPAASVVTSLASLASASSHTAESLSERAESVAPSVVTTSRPDYLDPSESPPADSVVVMPLESQYAGSEAAAHAAAICNANVDMHGKDWKARGFYMKGSIQRREDATPKKGSYNKGASTLISALSDSVRFPIAMRSPDREQGAEAWAEFRPILFSRVRAALEQAAAHIECVRALMVAASDPKNGHRSISTILEAALEDTVLQELSPLFHWDVIFHQIDTNMGDGTRYATDTSDLKWRTTTSRLPTEALPLQPDRVAKAYCRKHQVPLEKGTLAQTMKTLCFKDTAFFEIAQKYRECLENDVSDPERGKHLGAIFWEEWHRCRNIIQDNRQSDESKAIMEGGVKRIVNRTLQPKESAFEGSRPATLPNLCCRLKLLSLSQSLTRNDV